MVPRGAFGMIELRQAGFPRKHQLQPCQIDSPIGQGSRIQPSQARPNLSQLHCLFLAVRVEWGFADKHRGRPPQPEGIYHDGVPEMPGEWPAPLALQQSERFTILESRQLRIQTR